MKSVAAPEYGSPSRLAWAKEVEDADSLGRQSLPRSPSLLNPNAAPFTPRSSPSGSRLSRGGRLSFSDSEASSGSASAGVAEVDVGAPRRRFRRRRPRHRRRRARAAPSDGCVLPRTLPASPQQSLPRSPQRLHPARLSAEPDAEGFREVHSRRRWRRRPSPARGTQVPADLVGLCFNCLREGHVRADCSFPSRCRACRREGHRARHCPEAHRLAGFKRGRSPGFAA